MKLDFSQNGLSVIFEITEEGRVVLEHFGTVTDKSTLKWSGIGDIQLAGENPNDHHGGKHTGASESFTLKYESHKYYENEFGNKLEFYLKNDKISAVQHYQFYKNTAAVRAFVTVTNTGDERVGLEYLSSFAFTGLPEEGAEVFIPHNSWCSELAWRSYTLSDLGLDRINGFTLKRVTAGNTGSWSCKEYLPMGAYSAADHTLLWQIEHSGSWHWEIGDIANMLYLKLSGPTESENGWYKELGKGESFESVKCCLSFGADFDSALGEMTKYRRVIIENNPENAALPVIFNDYMNCLWAEPTTEKMLPIIDKAAKAGAEYYCMDAGWYADGTWWETVGEWMPCEWRFPGGIKKVFDYIREKGMVPGIWLELEVVGIHSPILKDFEDECFFMRHGKKVIDHGRYHFDLRHKKVRDYLTSVVDRVVGEYGVGYIKMDYNIDAGAGTEVDSDSFGDGLLEHNRAYLSWIGEIREKYPALILENCASGGMRMEYASLVKSQIQSTSDQTDYRATAVIAANCATAVLPEQAAVWAYPLSKNDKNEAAFNMVNAMLTRIQLSGDIANLSDKQFETVVEGIKVHKSIRNKISRFLPFYPLGLNRQKAPFACVGYRCEEEIFLGVWRLGGEEERVFIPLKTSGKTEILYPLSSDSKIEEAQGGITVTLPDKYSAVVIRIK